MNPVDDDQPAEFDDVEESSMQRAAPGRWRRFAAMAAGTLLIAGGGFVAWYWLTMASSAAAVRLNASPAAPVVPLSSAPLPEEVAPQTIEIGLAYGSEKELWLKWAVDEFTRTAAGVQIRITLIPFGTVEAAHAIVNGDTRIHAWTPASSLYEPLFVERWKLRYGEASEPILKQQALALTPMVFVMWAKRYEAFKAKYGELSFSTIAQAIDAEGGWETIAGKPEWGLFKFGHTHPNRSNSGLMTLLLMANDFFHKTSGLTATEVVAPKFQNYMARIERGVSSLPSSTGFLMKEMVLKGPSSFDLLMLYEASAIERLQSAEGRWDELRVIYPRVNIWSTHPYYVLAAPWCTPRHQAAAERFMEFLLSETAQRQALEHGYRPGNENVPIRFPESPFIKFARYGLQIDLPAMCQYPGPDVVDNLQQAWLRAAGSR